MQTMPQARLLPPWGDHRWQIAAQTPYGQTLVRELAALEAGGLQNAAPVSHP